MSLPDGPQVFSKLRAFFWPIHRSELKKFLALLAISFLLSFDYNILRPLKDTFVVTASGSGAEVIPFIKVWAMFPVSLLLTYIYVRVSNRCSRENVFYIMFSLFLGFFFLFAFFLYPIRENLHAHSSADTLLTILPAGCKGFVAMYRYWIFTLFYVMSELWSNIVLALLMWGFLNQVTRLDEARRFYGLFGLGINFSGIVSGQISIFISEFSNTRPLMFSDGPWGQSMTILVLLVLISGFLTMAIFRWLNSSVLSQEEKRTTAEKNPEKKKFSMRENIRYVLTSRYVLSIALIIIAYNLVINLVEILWKHEVAALYPNPLDFNIYMNQITSIIGVIATITAVVVSGNAIRKFGWTFTAMLTPLVLFFTSVGFFGFFFAKDIPEFASYFLGIAPLNLVVFFGSLQNCLSRAAKYTVFDATKEMAFIPLSESEKIKAKAAVDGVCNRLGKSAGSVIYNVLLVLFSSITASIPYVAVALFIAIALWMFCVKTLGKRFDEMSGSPATSPVGAF
jgi:AAA family ATP:ADP antiporter